MNTVNILPTSIINYSIAVTLTSDSQNILNEILSRRCVQHFTGWHSWANKNWNSNLFSNSSVVLLFTQYAQRIWKISSTCAYSLKHSNAHSSNSLTSFDLSLMRPCRNIDKSFIKASSQVWKSAEQNLIGNT